MPEIPLYIKIKLGIIKVNRESPSLHRFWAGVDKDGPVHPEHGQCWIWTKWDVGNNYGGFCGDKDQYAHRAAYRLLVGDIPERMWVLHKCDNRKCVNPGHLFLGDNQSNTADRQQKDRQAKGEKNGASKLTEADVLEIRARYTPYHRVNGMKPMAREFGVDYNTVGEILHRKSWKHI